MSRALLHFSFPEIRSVTAAVTKARTPPRPARRERAEPVGGYVCRSVTAKTAWAVCGVYASYANITCTSRCV